MQRRFYIGILLWLLGSASGQAHEVHHQIEAAGAVAVRLSYADGKPFAFEAYEAYAEGQATPAHVGRTDATGRALFLPGDTRRWRLKAYAADGHGVDIRVEAPAVAAVPCAMPPEGPNRASLLLFGLALLLGGFGLLQLWLRRKP